MLIQDVNNNHMFKQHQHLNLQYSSKADPWAKQAVPQLVLFEITLNQILNLIKKTFDSNGTSNSRA